MPRLTTPAVGTRSPNRYSNRIGGQGNVLLVTGIPGLASSDSFDNGVNKALKEMPASSLSGRWRANGRIRLRKSRCRNSSPHILKKSTLFSIQSPAETGVLKALLQSGRPIVPITLAGEEGTLCYWKAHPEWMKEGYYMWPPGDEFQLSFDVLIRTLQGQGPKGAVHRAAGVAVHAGGHRRQGACEFAAPILRNGSSRTREEWFPESLANQFFLASP